MPFAVTLRLDPPAAAAIAAMWQVLSDQAIDDDRASLGYPPHVTLAILPDATPPDRLRQAVETCGTGWAALPIRLCGLALFPPGTLWAAPVVTRALLDRHAELLASLADLDIDPHYRTDRWVPHITLAESLARPDRALAALRRHPLPPEARLDRLDLLRFRPVDIRCSHPLAGGGGP